jgi:hypothetical protein
MTVTRAVLSKLVHEVVADTIFVVTRVVVATPIMAHLMSKNKNLFLSNEGEPPTPKTAQTGIINDPLLLSRICKSLRTYPSGLTTKRAGDVRQAQQSRRKVYIRKEVRQTVALPVSEIESCK